MLYKKIIYLILFSLALTSCLHTKSIYIDVMRPSNYEYSSPLNKFSIEKPSKINIDIKGVKPDTVLYFDLWLKSFTNAIAQAGLIPCDTLNARNDSNNITLKVHAFDISTKVIMQDISDQLTDDGILMKKQRAFLQLEYYIAWQINDAYSKPTSKKYYQINYVEWKDITYNGETVKDSFPDGHMIINKEIEKLGADAANLLLPQWITVKRSFYTSNKKDHVLAEYYISVQEWENAAELWKKEMEENDKTARYFTYNMALASEMIGNLDIAIFWAEKSAQQYGNAKASKYLKELYLRKNEQIKLGMQFGE